MSKKYNKPLFVDIPFDDFLRRLCKVSREEIDKLIARKEENNKNS